MMALCRGMQSVDRLRGDGHRGIEPERPIRRRQVVVDRLRDAHDVHPQFLHSMRDRHRPVPADDHNGVETQRAHELGDLARDVGVAAFVEAEGVGAVAGSEDGAAKGEDAADIVVVERANALLDQAQKPILEPDDLGVMLDDEAFGDGANHGVQAGAIAAAGEKANA